MDLILKALKEHGKKNNYHLESTWVSFYYVLRIFDSKLFKALDDYIVVDDDITKIGYYVADENVVVLSKAKLERISISDPDLFTKITKYTNHKINKFKKKLNVLKDVLNGI